MDHVNKNLLHWPTGLRLLALSALLLAGPAHARVSLTDIDAKLNALLAAAGAIDPGDLVTLRSFSTRPTECFNVDPAMVRVSPTGTFGASEFVVPAGKLLLITHVAWTARRNPNAAFPIGREAVLSLRAAEPNDFGTVVYNSENVSVTAANQDNLLGTHENINPGILIAAGRHLCGSVAIRSQNSSIGHRLNELFLRGVLLDAGS